MNMCVLRWVERPPTLYIYYVYVYNVYNIYIGLFAMLSFAFNFIGYGGKYFFIFLLILYIQNKQRGKNNASTKAKRIQTRNNR